MFSFMGRLTYGLAVLSVGLILGFFVGVIWETSERARWESALPADQHGKEGLVQYCLSPDGDCVKVILFWIARANASIHILIFDFSLDSIRDALIKAKNRGIDVRIVMEQDTISNTGSEYRNLKQAGIDVRLDANSALMHDKTAVIDNHIIITGSYNWTASANNRNNDNLVVIDSQAWAEAYEAEFQRIYKRAHA